MPDKARLAELAAALGERALALPIAVRAESRLAVACADAASRLVVAVGALIEDAELAAVAAAALRAHVPVEWELRGPLAEIPALVDRALVASRAGGLDDFAISVDAGLAVHAARAAAAR